MGKVDELHKKVFHAIHVEKQTLGTAEQITAWAEKQGIPKAKFVELYNSFSVATKARKATQLQDAYAVDGVPALGIRALLHLGHAGQDAGARAAGRRLPDRAMRARRRRPSQARPSPRRAGPLSAGLFMRQAACRIT